MEWVYFLRWAHVVGAAVLLGTGAGIAFFSQAYTQLRIRFCKSFITFLSPTKGVFTFTAAKTMSFRRRNTRFAFVIAMPRAVSSRVSASRRCSRC